MSLASKSITIVSTEDLAECVIHIKSDRGIWPVSVTWRWAEARWYQNSPQAYINTTRLLRFPSLLPFVLHNFLRFLETTGTSVVMYVDFGSGPLVPV